MDNQVDHTTEDGDRSFCWLYERYYGRVILQFLRRGLSHEDSRDLTQETFLRVYRGMQHFREEASPETWIRRIAVNTLNNWLSSRRTQKREATETSLESAWEAGELVFEDEGTLLPSRDMSVLEELVAQERREELARAIEDLPPRMFEAVKLRLVEGLKYREIAERQGVSVDTVKSHFFQAKYRLRRKLAAELPVRPTQGEDENE